MKNGVKMIDIAKKLNVSVVTVSNALGGKDGVSEELRAKIRETAENMGYKPSNSKQDKKKNYGAGSGKSVGILTAECFVGARGTFYWELTANISNKLSALNVYTVYECVTADNEKNCVLPKMLTENKIDGLIVIGQLGRPYTEILSHIEIPLVFVDFYDNHFNVDSIVSDNFFGGYALADYLVKKGLPFRSAYKIAGELVAYCIQKNTVLEDLPLEVYKEYSALFEEDLYPTIDLMNCVEKRISQGGTSVSSVEKQINYVKASLK